MTCSGKANVLAEALWLRKCLRLPVRFFRAEYRGLEYERATGMNISAVSAPSGLHAVSGASTGAPPQQKMSNLFDSIDTSGSGSINQSQFEQAFQTKNPPTVFQNQGAQAIFTSLDPNGTGSVSKQDFVSTMSGLMASLRADNSGGSTSQPADTLTASLQALSQIGPASAPPTTPPGTLLNYSA
jgi:EF hand domain-containing protein